MTQCGYVGYTSEYLLVDQQTRSPPLERLQAPLSILGLLPWREAEGTSSRLIGSTNGFGKTLTAV
jgi:hypothetical protein